MPRWVSALVQMCLRLCRQRYSGRIVLKFNDGGLSDVSEMKHEIRNFGMYQECLRESDD